MALDAVTTTMGGLFGWWSNPKCDMCVTLFLVRANNQVDSTTIDDDTRSLLVLYNKWNFSHIRRQRAIASSRLTCTLLPHSGCTMVVVAHLIYVARNVMHCHQYA